MRTWNLLVWCALGCGSSEPVEDTGTEPPAEPKGACGEVSEHDLVLTGVVQRDGEPAEGARVALEERAWHGGGKIFGSAVSEAGGRFTLNAVGVVSVEDCWGSALAYYVKAERDDASGELGVNGPLYHAISDAEGEVEIHFPIEMD